MKNRPNLNLTSKLKKAKRCYFTSAIVLTILTLLATPALAAGNDPLSAINNLSTFVFAAIRAIGIILLGWGVVQIGMSLQSHDPSQRSTGFLTFFGGLMIAFAKEILDLILA